MSPSLIVCMNVSTPTPTLLIGTVQGQGAQDGRELSAGRSTWCSPCVVRHTILLCASRPALHGRVPQGWRARRLQELSISSRHQGFHGTGRYHCVCFKFPRTMTRSRPPSTAHLASFYIKVILSRAMVQDHSVSTARPLPMRVLQCRYARVCESECY